MPALTDRLDAWCAAEAGWRRSAGERLGEGGGAELWSAAWNAWYELLEAARGLAERGAAGEAPTPASRGLVSWLCRMAELERRQSELVAEAKRCGRRRAKEIRAERARLFSDLAAARGEGPGAHREAMLAEFMGRDAADEYTMLMGTLK